MRQWMEWDGSPGGIPLAVLGLVTIVSAFVFEVGWPFRALLLIAGLMGLISGSIAFGLWDPKEKRV